MKTESNELILPEEEKNKSEKYLDSISNDEVNKESFEIIDDIEKPSDILKYPKEIRKTLLSIYKERLLKEKINLANKQDKIINFIEEKFNNIEELDRDLLEDYIEELDIKIDREKEFILKYFENNLQRIKTFKSIYDKFGKKDTIIALTKDSSAEDYTKDFEIDFSPYSVRIILEDENSFKSFCEKFLEGEDYGETFGVSSNINDTPVIISYKHDQLEDTITHEEQHKKFTLINFGSESIESNVDRVIVDEIFARLSEDEIFNINDIYYKILLNESYKLWEEKDDEYYKNKIKSGLNIIDTLLEEYKLTNKEVINLLSTEPIKNWKRFLDQMDSSMAVQEETRK